MSREGPGGSDDRTADTTRRETTDADAEPRTDRDGRTDERRETGSAERVTSWVTETVVRSLVVLFGVLLVLLALGEIAGVPLIEMIGDFLTSSVGQWTIIGAFGLLLIVIATKRWTPSGL